MSKTNTSATAAPANDDGDYRLSGPGRNWRQSTWKNYILAMAVEFIGTFLFLFFAFGGTQAAKLTWDPTSKFNDPAKALASPDLLLYVAFAFGFSLTVNVWVFYRVSGGLFNPAITLGFVIIGAMSPLKRGLLAASQLLGGIAASGLVDALLPGGLAVGTALAPGVSIVQGLFLEVFLTAELMITIFFLAVEKHRGTFIAPLGIGLSFFITQLFGVYFTGGSLNPARSLGPAVITGDLPGYHWIYWLGPVLGAALAAGVYKFLLFADYTTINPNQDSNGLAPCEAAITQARTAGKLRDLESAESDLNGAGPSRS